ncbi:MAG: FoF1 ATP synthase subunit gamma [Gammaproteobacteria bacterium]|jgi:F-type H+-transporting ATPase subunit gamma
MTKRSELKKHIDSLGEIKNIVAAMKNLSLIEISKTTKFLENQIKVIATLEEAATDFMHFSPNFLLLQEKPITAYVLIGSERGFCGDFNEAIIKHFLDLKEKNKELTIPYLIVIGRKLTTKILETDFATKIQANNKIKFLDGPSAFEEIHSVIFNLIKTLEKINEETKKFIYPGSWSIICNEELQNNVQTIELNPFSNFGLLNTTEKTSSAPFPPLLNIKSEQFLEELLDQYLFAILHQIFFKSFMAENRQRLLHMENAIRWLDKNKDQLELQLNMLRQEEITEEIEVILLSAKAIIEEMKLEV